MRETQDGMNKRLTFRDSHELLAYVSEPLTLADDMRSSIVGTAEFTGTASLEEAITLARRGWKEGVQHVNAFKVEIEKIISGLIPVPQPRFNVTGQRFHTGRWLSGNPKYMVSLVDTGVRRESHQPRNLRLVCNISASGAIGAEERKRGELPRTFLTRGAAIIALVNALQRHGYRVRVDLVSVAQTGIRDGDTLEHYVTVKSEGEPVSVDKLAFFMMHPSALRRIMFAAREREPLDIRRHFGIGRDVRGGYGFPGTASDKGDIYLDRVLSTTDWSEAFTLAWLKSTLAQQGIVIEGK